MLGDYIRSATLAPPHPQLKSSIFFQWILEDFLTTVSQLKFGMSFKKLLLEDIKLEKEV